MGTERTKELQQTIHSIIDRVGWSRKALARQLHWELHDTDDDEEIRLFEERLKKELTRPTTKPELLEYYLDVLRRLPEVERADLVAPQYIPTKRLGSEIEGALRGLSRQLSESLTDSKEQSPTGGKANHD